MIMNSKKIAIGIILLLFAVYLSGCISADDVSGTYRCTADDGILYLQNGEYEMLIDKRDGGGGAFGMYSIKDDMILLKMEFLGVIVPLTVDGRDLIDPDGDRWVRD